MKDWERWHALACEDSNFLEAIVAAIYDHWLQPGDHAVDGGANHGLHTWRMSEIVGPTGLILAVEPVPPLASTLTRKARRRSEIQLKVIEAALGRANGSSPFTWVRAAATRSGLKSRQDLARAWRSSIAQIDVSIRRLDDLADELNLAPRFIKLDLEGGEFDALRGAKATLLRSRPIVVFEDGRQSAADLYSYSRDEWFAFFECIKYSVHTLFGEAFSRDKWDDSEKPWYFIAVPLESSAQEFLDQRLATLISEVEALWRRSFPAFGRRWPTPTWFRK